MRIMRMPSQKLNIGLTKSALRTFSTKILAGFVARNDKHPGREKLNKFFATFSPNKPIKKRTFK